MATSRQSIIQAINTLQSQGARPSTFAIRELLSEGPLATISAVLQEWQQSDLRELPPPEQLDESLQQLIDSFSAKLQNAMLASQKSDATQLRTLAYSKLEQNALEQHELATALDRLIEERQHLQQKNQALQKQLSTQDHQLQTALQAEQLATTRAVAISEERDRLLKELHTQRQALTGRETEISKLSEAKQRLQTQLDSSKNSVDLSKNQLKQLEIQLRELQHQRDEQAQLHTKAATVASRAEQARAEQQNLLKPLTAENQQFKQTNATLERRLNALERDAQQSKQQALQAIGHSDALENERDRLLADSKSLRQKIVALENNTLSLTEHLARYRTQAEQEKTSHQQTRQHLSTLEQQLHEFTKHLESLGKQRLISENRSSRQDEELQHMRTELKQELHDLLDDRNQLLQKFENEHRLRIEAQQTIAELRVQLAQQEVEMRQLALDSQQQIGTLQARINELEIDLQAAQANYRSQFATTDNRRE